MRFLTENGIDKEQYEAYFETLSSIYPKRFYDFFKKCNGFHDYSVLGFSYLADTSVFKVESDKFELTLESDIVYNDDGHDHQRLKIQFDRLKSVKMTSSAENISDEIVLIDPYQKFISIDCVYYVEIGIDANGDYTFDMLTNHGFLLSLVFKKVKIIERKEIRW